VPSARLNVVLKLTVELFREYLRVVIDQEQIPHRDGRSPHRDVAVEALEKIRQMTFILARLESLGPTYRSEPANDEVYLEVKTLTEAFYYVGFRVQEILKDLPGLTSFECIAIRDIRNHLLEHPEGRSSRVFTPSFGWAADAGPVIKPARDPSEGQAFWDAGLFVNAVQFRDAVNPLLERAIADACA
jgi:hypothetical protein